VAAIAQLAADVSAEKAARPVTRTFIEGTLSAGGRVDAFALDDPSHAAASWRIRSRFQPSSAPSSSATREATAPSRSWGAARRAEARAAKQDIGDRARLLGARCEDDLGEHVGLTGDDRLGELGALGGDVEDAAGGVAVAEGSWSGAPSGRAIRLSRSSSEASIPSWISASAAGRLAAVALDQAIDDLLRHPPPGRQFAAGDLSIPDEVS